MLLTQCFACHIDMLRGFKQQDNKSIDWIWSINVFFRTHDTILVPELR